MNKREWGRVGGSASPGSANSGHLYYITLCTIWEYIEAAPTYSSIDLAVMMAYAAGVQHGKHIERAKRKQRASLQQ